MKGVSAAIGMLHVVLATELSLWGELHPTVIEEAFWVDLGIVLKRERRFVLVCSMLHG